MHVKLWLLLLLFIVLLVACDEGEPDFQAVEDEDELIAAVDESTENFVDDPFEELTTEQSEELPYEPLEDVTDDSFSGIEAAECPFDEPNGFDVTCGYLDVPENRTLPDSQIISLAYAVVHAAEDEGRPPIVYLAGGPGGSAIDDFVSDPEGWQYPFTRSRDLILIDQRGTGYSWPTLDCPELAEEYEFEDENPEVSCHERLVAEGIDLTAYNTAENAADVAALRQALGIDSWDLLGISYGTRLALNIMRDHPEGVRSVVLDSVFPPNADTPGEEGLSGLWSLQWLFDECYNDIYCNDSYPDLETVFLETVMRLNDTPVDGFYGDDVAFSVINALNSSELIPLVPSVIYSVAEGDIGALDEIAADEYGSNRQRFQAEEDVSDSEGMYNSVICHDEYIFGDYETAEARVVAEAPEAIEAILLQPVADLFQVCTYWGAGAAQVIENEPVYSDIPTLILAGQYDSATPPEWANLTASTLANVYVYEFPGAGHSLLSADECAIEITTDFLDLPQQTPDSSCIADIEWPYFE